MDIPVPLLNITSKCSQFWHANQTLCLFKICFTEFDELLKKTYCKKIQSVSKEAFTIPVTKF